MRNRRVSDKRRGRHGGCVCRRRRLAGMAAAQAPAARRRAMLGGRRITVIDIHAHHFVPEVIDIVRGTPLEMEFKGQAGNKDRYLGPGWLQYMDKEGIDISVLNMNPWWYGRPRPCSPRLRSPEREDGGVGQTLSGSIRRNGDMCVAVPGPRRRAAGIRRQEAELPRAPIGGSVEGQELSDRKFDPFWAKAEQLGVMLFMHPQQAPGTTSNQRLGGKGALGNTIGNPLETTVFLSHLIFEGTLDRFQD